MTTVWCLIVISATPHRPTTKQKKIYSMQSNFKTKLYLKNGGCFCCCWFVFVVSLLGWKLSVLFDFHTYYACIYLYYTACVIQMCASCYRKENQSPFFWRNMAIEVHPKCSAIKAMLNYVELLRCFTTQVYLSGMEHLDYSKFLWKSSL